MARRTPETLVDWLVVGIAPFLIMLLVGSLVFYLVEVFYLGNYPLRLLWVLGLFVMAIVCIARISMEEGAAMYAVPLAGAVGIALSVFVEVKGPLAALGPMLNWMLMGIVWWSAHKLTWDCTLIEGGRDFTGQGLMQTTGLDRYFRVKTTAPVAATEVAQPPPDLAGTSSTTPAAAVPVWKWWQSEKRPHAPGVWVVYFSIAALPLFGLGQWFMPADGLDLRRRAFWLLVIYVAAGLCLLMATSFLSLRRYLRQRNLEMPGEMAMVWLGTGSAMIFILLLLASFLPRPIPEYSITHLAPPIKSPELNPSRWGWGKEGAKPKPGAAQTATQGEPAKQGQPGQQTSPQGQPTPGAKGKDQANSPSGSSNSGSQGSAGKSADKLQSQSQQSQSQNSGDKKTSQQNQASQSNDSKQASDNKSPSNNQQPSENKSQQPSSENKSDPPSESSPPPNNAPDNAPAESQQTPPLPNETQVPPPTNYLAQAWNQVFAYLAHAAKWLFYLIVIAVIAYNVWQHRERLLAAWQQLLRELRELWNKWFGVQPAAAVAIAPVAAPPPKRFAEYADPFTTGLAARWSLAELVRYTFEALEARGREHNCPRSNDQTPLEYATAVGQVEPAFANEFRSLADLYGQLAFARGMVSPQSTSLLQQLWQRWK